eukprot:7158443-Pyramimonas_sp.AAC.1
MGAFSASERFRVVLGPFEHDDGAFWGSEPDRGTVADIVHYSSALPGSFDPRDDASTWEMR